MLGALLGTLSPCVPAAAWTAPSDPLGTAEGRFASEDDNLSGDPYAEERSRAPLEFGYFLMDLTARATRAFDAGDYEAAVRYYGALVEAVPDRSAGHTKLCESYVRLGNLNEALRSCRAALGAGGARAVDYLRFVELLLRSEGELGSEERSTIDEILSHLKAQNVELAALSRVECEVAVRTSDETRLEECTRALARIDPENPRTIAYLWSLALLQKNRANAERLLEQARASGMNPEAIDEMQTATAALLDRSGGWWLWAAAGALGSLACVPLMWRFRRRGTEDSGDAIARDLTDWGPMRRRRNQRSWLPL